MLASGTNLHMFLQHEYMKAKGKSLLRLLFLRLPWLTIDLSRKRFVRDFSPLPSTGVGTYSSRPFFFAYCYVNSLLFRRVGTTPAVIPALAASLSNIDAIEKFSRISVYEVLL